MAKLTPVRVNLEVEAKPGYKTTEFWLTAAVTLLAAIAGMLPEGTLASQIVLALMAAASVFGYGVSRGMVKASAIRSAFHTDDGQSGSSS